MFFIYLDKTKFISIVQWKFHNFLVFEDYTPLWFRSILNPDYDKNICLVSFIPFLYAFSSFHVHQQLLFI